MLCTAFAAAVALVSPARYDFVIVGGGTAGDAALSPFLWEASYSFKVNDSITMIPAVFGGTDVVGGTDEDIFGAALTTKFKF